MKEKVSERAATAAEQRHLLQQQQLNADHNRSVQELQGQLKAANSSLAAARAANTSLEQQLAEAMAQVGELQATVHKYERLGRDVAAREVAGASERAHAAEGAQGAAERRASFAETEVSPHPTVSSPA